MALHETQLELMTVDDVAASLKLSRNSVYRLGTSGALTPIHVGGLKSLRFDAVEVRELVDNSRGLDWRKQETS